MSADCASPPSILFGIGSARTTCPGRIPSCNVAQTFDVCAAFHAPLLPFLLVRMGACYSRVALDIRVRMLTCLGSPAIVEVAAIH